MGQRLSSDTMCFVSKNQSMSVCEEKWIKVMPVHGSKPRIPVTCNQLHIKNTRHFVFPITDISKC